MRNNPSAALVYACHDGHSYVMRALVILKEDVSYKNLRYAVDMAIKRYPYLAQKIEHNSDESELVFLHNNNPIPIYDCIEERKLNSEETNYHIQCISYSGKTICFDMCHGFADGTSMTEWMKTVLYYYISNKYNITLDKTGIRTIEDKITDEELIDPLKPIVDNILSNPTLNSPPPPLDKSAHISDFYITTPDQHNVTFWFNSKELMRFAKTSDGTPTSIVVALLVKILDNKNQNVNQPIVSAVAKNLRAGLNSRLTHHSHNAPIFIKYPKRVRHHSIETLSTMARGNFILMQDDEIIKEMVNGFAKSCANLLSLPNIEIKKQIAFNGDNMVRTANTFAVSYTGQKGFGSVEEYIDKVYAIVGIDVTDLMIQISSVGDKLCFSFIQGFKEDDLALDFISYLENNGVAVYDFESKKLIFPKVII